jgi:signal transduction histidine kinase
VTVAHAHVRNFLEESRVVTALILARTALEPTPIFRAEGGRDEVVAAVAAHGFLVRMQRGKPLDASAVVGAEQLANGQLQVVAPLDDGRATMRFTARLSPEVTTSGLMIGLAALLLAGGLAFSLGRALASDLVIATDHLGTLGLEVDQGANEAQRPGELATRARFREVVALGENIQRLAQRFQLFADTQERALQAKARDRRMKQLLFASVSHDLKSPLNAILGFADLVSSQPLSSGQRESIDMVGSRGRELQALIETILDAARVDAGQLSLTPEPTTASELIAQAAEKARHLQAAERPHIAIEAQPHLPTLFVDPIHTSRALGVLISHALISCAKSPSRQVRIAAHLAERRHTADADMLCITIEYSTRSARPSLLETELQGLGSPEAKRSMVLQLSLARSVIELHGGHVHAQRAGQRSSIVRVSLPVWQHHDIENASHRQPAGLRAT